MTDPAITIAGLRAQVSAMIDHLETANQSRVNFSCGLSKMEARAAGLEAERDALAAQLAEARARLDAAPRSIELAELQAAHEKVLASERARIAGLESAANERSAEVARLTARVAELEARTALTVEDAVAAAKSAGWSSSACRDAETVVGAILAALGPVTLPAQDRAEELLAAFVAEHGALLDRSLNGEAAIGDVRAVAMRRALASLGAPPTSPPAARPVFAGVSEEELALEYARAVDRIPGIRAVLARLEVSLVAPVDPEAVARAIVNEIICSGTLSVAAAKSHVRRTLTAAGIPVTPEAGK